MRLMCSAALALAASLLAVPAHAQTSFSIAAGASLPVGNTADALSMGYNVTAGLGIKPPLAPLGLRIEGMLNSFEYKSATRLDGSMRVMALTANGTLSGPAFPMAYLIGGIGMYNSKASVTGFRSDAETDFGFNIGGGLNFPLTGFSTFGEIRYHHIPATGGAMKFVPITFGIRF